MASFQPLATIHSDVALSNESQASFPDFAPNSPGDSDIGEQLILRSQERVKSYYFRSDAFGYWTDNVAHAATGAQEDWMWGWSVAAGGAPRLADNLFGTLGVSQQWFRYDKFDSLDFEDFDVTAGLAYTVPQWGNTTFFANYSLQRLTHDFDELMNRHSLRVGASKIWVINRRSSILTLVEGVWDVANDADALKRNEYTAEVAWAFKLTHEIELALDYRYSYLDYAAAGRADSLNLIGFQAKWSPRKWLELYASLSWSFNRSNYDAYDYDAGMLGGGLGVRIKF